MPLAAGERRSVSSPVRSVAANVFHRRADAAPLAGHMRLRFRRFCHATQLALVLQHPGGAGPGRRHHPARLQSPSATDTRATGSCPRPLAQKGTPNYDLHYSERKDREPISDEVWVKVRGGRVVQMVENGEVLRFDDVAGLVFGPVTKCLPRLDLSSQTVEGMFDAIEKRLKEDLASTGRRNYATASFDSRDGHPVRYVHRIAGTNQRLEWQIKLTRFAPGS